MVHLFRSCVRATCVTHFLDLNFLSPETTIAVNILDIAFVHNHCAPQAIILDNLVQARVAQSHHQMSITYSLLATV